MAKVLVIEDNSANMRLATLLLTGAGHEALCAVDAESGILLAQAEQPDLILMDIQLPGMDGLAATRLLKKDPRTSFIPVIALTALAMKADQEKTRLAGCDAYMAKPLRYKELYAAIDGLLLRHSPFAAPSSPMLAPPPPSHAPAALVELPMPSREEALRAGRLVLVAEDNPTNQKLILRQLALLGIAADVASNGQLAMDCWESTPYALLLTDLHMPQMDGYELAAAIRRHETMPARIPIIALTADLIKGGVEHCQAMGMDDYLSKPLALAELRATLEKWLPGFQPTATNVPAAVSTEQSSTLTHVSAIPADQLPVDVRVLEGIIGADPLVVLDMLNDYQTSAIQISQALRAACLNGQAGAAGAQGHKLLSSAKAVGAIELARLCYAIEQAGKLSDMGSVETLFSAFASEFDRVSAFLDALKAKSQPLLAHSQPFLVSDLRP